MVKPKFIKSENYSTKSQRYDELLKEGIEWIQRFSGNNWTDYNYHDPGITFLEQICYAITDLGYKSNFPIEDILFVGRDKFDLEDNNLLYPPHKILPSNPSTTSDYRKLIVDSINSVQNAWVYHEKDNLQNIAGLYSVKVQLKDNSGKNIIDKSIKEVYNLLMQNRSVGTDFISITPLRKDEIKFEATITLDSFAVGEEVLAHIYKNIEESITSKPIFYDYNEVEKDGYKVEDLYAGPLTNKGFLNEFGYNEKTSEIYISELKEVIYKVDGVLEVDDLVFYKNGIKVFDDYISFDKDSYPSLVKIFDVFFEDDFDGLRFFRNDSLYKIDKIIYQQIYDSLVVGDKNFFKQKFKSDLDDHKGRFTKEQFEKYYSIMREMPSLYGLREDELPSKSSNLRKAQVNQLRAFLLLFDQLMSNHVSQVSNIRNLFSIDSNLKKTLFSVVPSDVPNLSKIIGNDKKYYEQRLNESIETESQFFERKNKILDHMIARFGETFDHSLIGKIHKLLNENLTENQLNQYALDAKVDYAKSLREIGYNRIKGFNYNSTRQDDVNLSGIEHRLKLKLNIKKYISNSLVNFFSKETQLHESNNTWRKKIIDIENGPSLEVLSLPQKAYKDNKIHFHLNNIESFKLLFLNGVKIKNYKIVNTKGKFSILYNGIDGFQPAVIYESDSENDCKAKMISTIEKMKEYNLKSEGFFMIENILLRPLSRKDYTLFIYDENRKKFFKSYYSADLDKLKDLRRDFAILSTDKKNYNVVKKANGKRFEIIIYDLLNKPMFRSCESFKLESDAKILIPKAIQFFSNVIIEDKIEDYSKMLVVNNISNRFPDDFNFSNHVNFIFPNWPLRFQNKELKNYIISIINEYLPAHLTYDIFYLDINQVNQLEQIFTKWTNLKKTSRFDQIDSKSLQIIQLLINYKKDGK